MFLKYFYNQNKHLLLNCKNKFLKCSMFKILYYLRLFNNLFPKFRQNMFLLENFQY